MSIDKILVIDNESRMCQLLKTALESEGYQVEIALDGKQGMKIFAFDNFGLVITDLKMPGKDGLQVLEEVKSQSPDTDVILMTAYATAQTAVEAMKKGAYDYLIKPFDMEELKLKVRHIFEKKNLKRENIGLKQILKEKYSFENIIGSSGKMQEVFRLVEKVCTEDTTVLIRGESGTGKELIAIAIHQNSPRVNKPFVAVNCAAIPENLLESELFGYEKGAFTGADKRKLGRFELAGEGTIFLDEIGDFSPALQAKLLRVLQTRQIERLGGTESIPIKARVIAATHQNLEELLKQGSFREDLYYRINVFPIFLPPLRERTEDIPALVEHFLKKYGKPQTQITPEALKILIKYPWPGNVRELENVIERAIILSEGDKIRPEDLPPHLQQHKSTSQPIELLEKGLSLREMEKQLLWQALEKAAGNKSQAAKLLGITRRKLYSMMERLKLEF
ncbi:hypothetical protein DRQ15_00015 [candidate division KSB1 bacterium]|nr:MAG: hypothetical protein DRQ15_00015 [candidate division KSB1 bacterium]